MCLILENESNKFCLHLKYLHLEFLSAFIRHCGLHTHNAQTREIKQ